MGEHYSGLARPKTRTRWRVQRVWSGPLTAQSLEDALATEQSEGRHPKALVVGTSEMFIVGVRLLGPRDSGIDLLRTVAAHVELDPDLGGGWELRE